MNKSAQIREIGAEMLLNFLYPELQDKWTARHEGTFYRNYSEDILSVSPESAEVTLSRDSFLNLLPQRLFSGEEDLKKGDKLEKHKELEQEMRVLSEAVLPLDSFAFRQRLMLERRTSELLEDKLEYVLRTYFGYDLAAEQNPYVREFAVLLPYVRNWRGSFKNIKTLLSVVFRCPVTVTERRWSETDSTREWIPEIRYELEIPDLAPEAYRSLSADLQPLREFLSEWFMPMEMRLELAVKHHQAPRPLETGLTLDYNTEL